MIAIKKYQIRDNYDNILINETNRFDLGTTTIEQLRPIILEYFNNKYDDFGLTEKQIYDEQDDSIALLEATYPILKTRKIKICFTIIKD